MQQDESLRSVIASWFDSVQRGDPTWIDRHLSTDPALRIVGTDPTEWLTGQGASDFLRRDAMALSGVKVAVNDLEAYSQGDIGWGIARPTITLPGDVTITPRWSGVFRREGGEWRAVQIHASLGIANEEAFTGVDFGAATTA